MLLTLMADQFSLVEFLPPGDACPTVILLSHNPKLLCEEMILFRSLGMPEFALQMDYDATVEHLMLLMD